MTSVSVSLWKTTPSACELPLEGGVVLDDAVVDDGDLAVAADVRMGIAVVGRAVRGPARVADADAARAPAVSRRCSARSAMRPARLRRCSCAPVSVATPALS